MTTQALTADAAVAKGDTYVSSALTKVVKAFLPVIDDGTNGFAINQACRFECTAGSPIEIVNADGVRVGFVPGYGQAVVVAEHGTASGDEDIWRFMVLAQAPPATIADIAAFTDPPAAAEMATLRTAVNNILLALENNGLLKAE